MTLPAPVGKHHTIWIRGPVGAPRAARYAVEGDHVVLFADGLDDMRDGTKVTASVHEIAGGPSVAEFAATLRDLDATQVAEAALYELLDHVPLGRTSEEVRQSFERHRDTRRVVGLIP